METEHYISGYCRCLDASRMVEVILEDHRLTQVDCDYTHCPHTSNCTVAAAIRQLENEA